MSSETRALNRLKACEKVIRDHQRIHYRKLENLMFYTYGILERTTAKYCRCLSELGIIKQDGDEWIIIK